MNNIINKPLVIGKFHPSSLVKYGDMIHYHIDIGEHDLATWQKTIKKLKPRTIIFGSNIVNREMLNIWREEMPQDQLFLIRRGASLARCDVVAAKKLNINVKNTPGSNAAYIAKFICDSILKQGKYPKIVTILGVGNIGSIVAQRLVNDVSELNLYSRSLQNNITQKQVLADLWLDQYLNVSSISSIQQGFCKSNCIIITLPYTSETKGLIAQSDIQSIPKNANFISTSFPNILEDEAIKELHSRDDINVIFDHLRNEFDHVYSIIGTKILRPNFIIDEKAAATDECQIAMDEAVMQSFQQLNLKNQAGEDIYPHSRLEEVAKGNM